MGDNPHHPKKNLLKKVLTSNLVLCDFLYNYKEYIFYFVRGVSGPDSTPSLLILTSALA